MPVHSFFAAGLAAAAFLIPTASGHMLMAQPVPFGADSLDNSPLSGAASFPCKQRAGVYKVTQMNKMAVGQSQQLTFKGSAVHGGGSCQVSISTDKEPTAQSKFKVIHSIEGGCPEAPVSFTLPPEVPNGQVTLSWTWFNQIGNREIYMNCSPVEVSGGASDSSGLDKLPDMFIANLEGIGSGCKTTESKDLEFPDPGKSLDKAPSAKLAPPACSGGGAGAGAGAGSGSGSGSGAGSGSGSGSSSGGSQDGSGSGSSGSGGSGGGSSGGNNGQYQPSGDNGQYKPQGSTGGGAGGSGSGSAGSGSSGSGASGSGSGSSASASGSAGSAPSGTGSSGSGSSGSGSGSSASGSAGSGASASASSSSAGSASASAKSSLATPATSLAATSAAGSKATVSAKPSVSASPSGSSGKGAGAAVGAGSGAQVSQSPQASGGATAGGGGTCSGSGLVCNGDSQFGLCNNGKVLWQGVAAGTRCVNGQIMRKRDLHQARTARFWRNTIPTPVVKRHNHRARHANVDNL